MRQLGKAFSILARYEFRQHEISEDLENFNAPSECYDLVFKNEEKRARIARKAAKAASGLNRRQFNQAIKHFHPRWMSRAVNQIDSRLYPDRPY
jgi:hypothetical protein